MWVCIVWSLLLFWKSAAVFTLSTAFTCSCYPASEVNMPPAETTNLAYTPPDGGWGWAVVFGAFISIGFSYAFPKSLTIYFNEIQEYFSISYSEIAWLSSVMLASMYAGGQWHCIFSRIWQRYLNKITHFHTACPLSSLRAKTSVIFCSSFIHKCVNVWHIQIHKNISFYFVQTNREKNA